MTAPLSMTFKLLLGIISLLFIQEAFASSPVFDAFSTAYEEDIFKSDGIYAKESFNISSLFESIFDQPMIKPNLIALLLPPVLDDSFTRELLETYEGVKETTDSAAANGVKEATGHATHVDNPHSYRPQMVLAAVDSPDDIHPRNYSHTAVSIRNTDYAKANETVFDSNPDTCKYLVLFNLKETKDSNGSSINVTGIYEKSLPRDFVFDDNATRSASIFDNEILRRNGLDVKQRGHPAVLTEGLHLAKELSGGNLSSMPNTTLGQQFLKTASVLNETAFPFNVAEPDVNIDTALITASKYAEAIQRAMHQDIVNTTTSQGEILGFASCSDPSLSTVSRRHFLNAGSRLFNNANASSSFRTGINLSAEYDCRIESRWDIRASMAFAQPSSEGIRKLIGKDSTTTSDNNTYHPLHRQSRTFTLEGDTLNTMQAAKIVASEASFYRTYAAGSVISQRVNATMYDRYADLATITSIANGTDSASILGHRFATRHYTVLAAVNNCTNL